MHPVSGRHERFSHTFAAPSLTSATAAVTGPTITMTAPVPVTSSSATTTSAATAVAAVAVTPTNAATTTTTFAVFDAIPCRSSGRHAGGFLEAALNTANTTTTTTASQSSSSHEHVGLDYRSPSLHPLSTSAALAAPPTPSNWMVRGPSRDGSPSTLSALGLNTTHDSGASASSFNSSTGNTNISPLLRPHLNSSLCSSGAAHDSAGEGEGFEGTYFPMERASGRKRTPRADMLSGPANSGNNNNVGSVGDADSLTTPSSTRLVFSRRTSMGGSVCEAGDDSCARVRRPGSCALAEEDVLVSSQTRMATDAAADGESSHRGEVQSTLHSIRGRGCGSSAAATAMPLTSNPPTLALSAAAITGVMNDVAATTEAATQHSPVCQKSSIPAVGPAEPSVHLYSNSTPMFGRGTEESQTKPALGGRSHARSGSSSSGSTFTTTRDDPPAGVCADTAGIISVPGNRIRTPTTAPKVSRRTTGQPKTVASPPHFFGLLSSAGITGSGGAHGTFSPTAFASHHFSSTAELSTFAHYSKASSYNSLSELMHNSDSESARKEEDDDDADDDHDGDKGQHHNTPVGRQQMNAHGNAVRTLTPHGAAASATVISATALDSPSPPAAASATVHPYDKTFALSAAESNGAAAVQEVNAGVAASPTPLMDVWTVSPPLQPSASVPAAAVVGVVREPSCNMSRSSSGSGPHHHHRHHHHRQQGSGEHDASVYPSAYQRQRPTASGPSSPPPRATVPVLSSTETHPALPATAQTHNSGNFLNYHPNFSGTFFGRFGVSSLTTTPTDVADGSAEGKAAAVPVQHSDAQVGLPPVPPPPPPPPPSRIPSPILRAAATISGGFAATPAHPRVTPTFGCANITTTTTTGPSSGRVTPAGRPQFGAVSPAPLLPPPPPPSPFAEGHDYTLQLQQPHHHVHCSLNRDSLTPLSGLRPLPRHGADKSTVASYRSTPDERGGMEAFIDGMPMMVLPPATLRSQQESGAPINTITTPATAGPAGAHMHAHGGHHHGNHHSGQNRLRDSSLGSSGGVQRSPFAKARPAGLSTKLATGQSREFVYTSSSSLYTSTPQTLTSTASDPLLLSFSSANLAAPMMSNGSNNNMNMSNCCGVNSSGGGSGDGTMNSAPSAQVTTPTPAPNVTTTDGFVMKPDAETVQSLPRGKVPRMPGCSMRDWTAHLAAKEADNRRGEQQQQQQQRHGSGSAPSSQSHQRTGIYSLFSGPSSSSSAGTLSAFSLPASQHSPSSRTALPRITPQEVAKHNTPDDLWIVIRNVVYDCTEFQRFHPGGEKLLLACAGRDATEVYDRFHVWVSCESFMGPYAVGVLAPPPPHKGGG